MALPLFEHAAEPACRIREARRVAFFFDLDGTLAPLRDHPDSVRIPPEVGTLVRALHRPPNRHTAIVSGRTLVSLTRFADLHGLPLVGNHGLEFNFGDGPCRPTEAARLAGLVKPLAGDLSRRLADVPGALVEDKELTVSVHYRLAPRDTIPLLERTVTEAVSTLPGDELVVRAGKEVLEIRPRNGHDKGQAVLLLLDRLGGPAWRGNILPVYVGDDHTDEDAFHALAHDGLTIRVGPGPTAASYFIADVAETPRLLRWLLQTVGGGYVP